MGPKKDKKVKKTKEKKDESTENGGVLSPEEQARLYLSVNRSLEVQLAERHDMAVKAMESKRELQSKVLDLQRDFERERSETFDITQDMTRQYKSMQEELLNRVNALENTNTQLQDQLELARVNYEEMQREKDRIISLKNLEIDELKLKMEEIALEFGEMLKETLEKMRERIEITNTNFDTENSTPMIRKLEEFSRNSITAIIRRRLLTRTSVVGKVGVKKCTENILNLFDALLDDSLDSAACKKSMDTLFWDMEQLVYEASKVNILSVTCQKELESYDALEQQIESSIDTVTKEIEELKEKVLEEKTVRAHKEEYEALSHVVNKLPSKRILAEEIEQEKIREEQAMNESKLTQRKLNLRSKQFSLLMSTIQDLKTTLQEEEKALEEINEEDVEMEDGDIDDDGGEENMTTEDNSLKDN